GPTWSPSRPLSTRPRRTTRGPRTPSRRTTWTSASSIAWRRPATRPQRRSIRRRGDTPTAVPGGRDRLGRLRLPLVRRSALGARARRAARQRRPHRRSRRAALQRAHGARRRARRPLRRARGAGRRRRAHGARRGTLPVRARVLVAGATTERRSAWAHRGLGGGPGLLDPDHPAGTARAPHDAL